MPANKNSSFGQKFLNYFCPSCFNTMNMKTKKIIHLTPEYAKKKL